MKHIYIFNESSRAAVYGIGTYIKQVINLLANQKKRVYYTVNINSDNKDLEEKCVAGIKSYYIPYMSYKCNSERYYRNILFLLQPFIEKNQITKEDEIIFHFNFYQQMPLIKMIKKYYPKSKIYFSIHYMDWCFMIKGNVSYFKKIISKETDDLLSPEEKKIAHQFKVDKEFFSIFDKIICLSNFAEQLLINEYKVSSDKIETIFNGLQDDVIFLSQEDKRKKKNDLFIHPDEDIILFVGRLDDIKGVDIVIDAFKYILKEKPNSKLIIVGDGDYNKYLERCHEIWGKIIFTGRIKKEFLYVFYQIADVGVMPSTHEQCSYVAIEMLAHGVPLVASTTTGLEEMIPKEFKHLSICAKENSEDVIISAEECADKILQVLNFTNTEKISISSAFRKRFLDQYNLDKMKDKLLDIY